MNAGRVEAFSDGVIAIIITIMVLELHVPADASLKALLANVPLLLVYALSFLTVAIMWVNHHHIDTCRVVTANYARVLYQVDTVVKVSIKICRAKMQYVYLLQFVQRQLNKMYTRYRPDAIRQVRPNAA